MTDIRIELINTKSDRIHRLLEYLAWVEQASREQREATVRNALNEEYK